MVAGGGTTPDSSANGLTAHVTGSLGAGCWGQALAPTSDGDGVRVDDNAALKPSSLTLVAWVKRSGTPGANRIILGKQGLVPVGTITIQINAPAAGQLTITPGKLLVAHHATAGARTTPRIAPARITVNLRAQVTIRLKLNGAATSRSIAHDTCAVKGLDGGYCDHAADPRPAGRCRPVARWRGPGPVDAESAAEDAHQGVDESVDCESTLEPPNSPAALGFQLAHDPDYPPPTYVTRTGCG